MQKSKIKNEVKFKQWKKTLQHTLGKDVFVSKSWLENEWKKLNMRTQQSAVKNIKAKSKPQLLKAKKEITATPPVLNLNTLDEIRANIGECVRCKLCEKRTHIVFGEGNPKAELMFVGEGPGEQEDLSGRPFVGRAGQLLEKIIEAMGLKRSDVFIANVVKCRPPNNRAPEPDEVATCKPFLLNQIKVIKPKVIVALGATALKCLITTDVKITQMRGRFTAFEGTKLMPTYHPAYLLRNPPAKKDVWEDMKVVMAELNLSIKKQ